MERMTKVSKILPFLLLAGALMANLAFVTCQMEQMSLHDQKVGSFIDKQLERQADEEKQENTYIEDGFRVSGMYEIRSTKQISDAYLNGGEAKLSEEDRETLKMASDVIAEVVREGMDNYEKELVIYEWMCDNIGHGNSSTVTMPGEGANNYLPHDVLKGKNAICVGYATTFRLFMNMLGMEVHVVHNDYHSWNLVEVEHGQWYHVDVYSDAGGCKYRNFNMTDELAKLGHDWDGAALPEACATAHSYAVRTAVPIESIYEIPKEIAKLMQERNASIFFRFSEKLEREKLPVADYMVDQINIAMAQMGMDKNLSGIWYPDSEDAYILGLFLNDYGETTGGFDEESEEAVRINEEIAKVFQMEPLTEE